MAQNQSVTKLHYDVVRGQSLLSGEGEIDQKEVDLLARQIELNKTIKYDVLPT